MWCWSSHAEAGALTLTYAFAAMLMCAEKYSSVDSDPTNSHLLCCGANQKC